MSSRVLVIAAVLFGSGCLIRSGPGGTNASGSSSNGSTASSSGGIVTSGDSGSNFAPVALTSGFLPDPASASGTSGGTYNANELGGACRGWIAGRPDHLMTLNSSFNFLRVYVHSDSDTTLVIQAPNGNVYCNDDANGGRNPAVDRGSWEPGTYRVRVGSYQQNDYAQYSIYFTEIRSNY